MLECQEKSKLNYLLLQDMFIFFFKISESINYECTFVVKSVICQVNLIQN